ncbi:MAG: TlpA family protein disulfide reductase [Chloroflexi bacterium]|nr:MAG: TlpA family protein disulfide reductase [Chloroflexota bacterium]
MTSDSNSSKSLKIFRGVLFSLVLTSLLLTACGSSSASTSPPVTEVSRPEWFSYELTDVQTGETFTINDYAGKVLLVETMAIWCPNCVVQAHEVRKLHSQLSNPDDLISVSLDVDVNEDAASLKEYSEGYGFDWHFAVAQLEVARALGNLYTAQYLNPPLSPMMIIDRAGNVHHLDYGLKEAETLQEIIEPFLDQ